MPDKIYPLFIWEHLPVGVAGLVIAAILAAAMSNLSAALNSLASTTVMDFLQALSRRTVKSSEVTMLAWLRARLCDRSLGSDPVRRRRCSRAVGQCSASRPVDRVDYLWLAAGRVSAGPVDATGGRNRGDVRHGVGLALMLYVRFVTPIAFTWYVLIGTLGHVRDRLGSHRLVLKGGSICEPTNHLNLNFAARWDCGPPSPS